MADLASERRLFREIRALLDGARGFQVTEPVSYDPVDPSFRAIQEFRIGQSVRSAEYLRSPHQERIERRLRLDERSAHFAVVQHGQVVASLRMTPPPFECAALVPLALDSFSGYYEVSRLQTIARYSHRPFLGQLLLLKAGLWLFERTECEGLVAVCRTERFRFFRRFGFNAVSPGPFQIESRPGGAYQLIAASRGEVLAATRQSLCGAVEAVLRGLNRPALRVS